MSDETVAADVAVPAPRENSSDERADLLALLARHRFFLRNTVRGLSDEQAATRSTVSELCLGGLLKHVAATEQQWADFIVQGPAGFPSFQDPDALQRHVEGFRMADGETLADILETYAATARRTDELVTRLEDLNATQPLPEAPWFEPGARWSARRVLIHIIAETAQHAGHADILREAIDGAKSMG